jgi:hypothetical protein
VRSRHPARCFSMLLDRSVLPTPARANSLLSGRTQRNDQRLQYRWAAVRCGMSSQSILPPAHQGEAHSYADRNIGVAASPDLPGFVAVSNNESSLRAFVGEQIASTCLARGFEVDTGPVGSVEHNVALWSIKIRNATPANGPNKVGGTDFLPEPGEGLTDPGWAE